MRQGAHMGTSTLWSWLRISSEANTFCDARQDPFPGRLPHTGHQVKMDSFLYL